MSQVERKTSHDWLVLYEQELQAMKLAMSKQEKPLLSIPISLAMQLMERKEKDDDWNDFLSWLVIVLLKICREYSISYENVMCELIANYRLKADLYIPWNFLTWERAWYMAEEREKESISRIFQHYYGIFLINSEEKSLQFCSQILSIYQLLYGGGDFESEEERQFRRHTLCKRDVIYRLCKVWNKKQDQKLILEKAKMEVLRYQKEKVSLIEESEVEEPKVNENITIAELDELSHRLLL